MTRAAKKRQNKATSKKALKKTAPSSNDCLRGRLQALVASPALRLVDLTQTLSPDFPPIVLPPEMGQSRPFRMEQISRYDENGPAWYWNNVSFGEHTGTHFDAPIHWISGRDLPNNSVDALPLEHFVAPACVIDCSAQAADNADFLLTAGHVAAWETRRTHSGGLMGADADRLVETRRPWRRRRAKSDWRRSAKACIRP